MTDRLRGVEQVGQPDVPVAIPIDDAGPVVDTSTPDPRPIPVAGDLVLNGPRFADVDALASAFGELEAIVRDLAATGHPVDEGDVCLLCAEITPSHVTNLSRALTTEERAGHHHPTCPWRLAVAWVSAHPVSGDPQ